MKGPSPSLSGITNIHKSKTEIYYHSKTLEVFQDQVWTCLAHWVFGEGLCSHRTGPGPPGQACEPCTGQPSRRETRWGCQPGGELCLAEEKDRKGFIYVNRSKIYISNLIYLSV